MLAVMLFQIRSYACNFCAAVSSDGGIVNSSHGTGCRPGTLRFRCEMLHITQRKAGLECVLSSVDLSLVCLDLLAENHVVGM